MRIAFVGAGEVSIETAKGLIKKGHEVIMVEKDKAKIDELSEEMDCAFVHGDGSKPDILREVNPPRTDFLFCLTDSDQANVLASLLAHSLGFKRVVTSIADSQFEGICRELGLEDTIIPSRTISRYLQDMVYGGEHVELSTVIKDDARFFTFVAGEEDKVPAADLNLPADARVVCYYRGEKFFLVDEGTKFRKGDEIVIITHVKNLPELRVRWKPNEAEKKDPGSEYDKKR